MLYLEDYLEMIEHLPQELKDRFTEIRELDLQVQNATDKLDDRIKGFFMNAKRMKPNEKESEFESVRKEYYKALEDADEKVHQASQMYDLVDRYLRRLDQELHKFKMELEADNAGITEVLEKRSLELDHPRERDLGVGERDFGLSMSSQKENRFIITGNSVTSVKIEKKGERKASVDKVGHSHLGGTPIPNKEGGITYSLGQVGAASTAIANSKIISAAQTAIAATQQMQQGRRTASLKASYDAINLGLHPQEFPPGRVLINAELQSAAQQALAATAGTSSHVEQKRNKRKSQHTTQTQEVILTQTPEEVEEPSLQETPVEAAEWYDPSEPRYCVCNQVSYGDMVACDQEKCPIEWFHYGCVGITSTPKGKWYCPSCSANMKRRGRR